MNNVYGDRMRCFLSVAAIISLFIFFWLLLYYEYPPGIKEIALVILGHQINNAKEVYGWYFGSSDGSYRKDKANENNSNASSIVVDGK